METRADEAGATAGYCGDDGRGGVTGAAAEPPRAGTVAQHALDASVARTAKIFRGTWTILTPLLAFPQAIVEDGFGTRQHLAVGTALVWGAAYVVLLRRGPLRRWVAVTDGALFASYLILAAYILPKGVALDSPNWIVGGTSVAIFVVSWVLPPLWTVTIAVVEAGAYSVGLTLSGHSVFADGHLLQAGIFVLQGLLAVTVIGMIRRGARQADATLDHVERARAELMVERSRLHGRRQFERELHDTVLSTLTVVARGTLSDRPDLVRARCERDLDLLDQLEQAPGTPGLFATIAWEAGCRAMSVRLNLPGDEPELPAEVIEAVAGAVRETLSNVERHAGVDSAELVASFVPGRLRITIRDEGRGFDPTSRSPGHTGIQRSVVERMVAVGGLGKVDSAPGAGTEVTISWCSEVDPAAPPVASAQARPQQTVAAAYRTGVAWALVLIALVWHLFCASQLIAARADYRPLWLEVAGWLGILLVVVGVAVRGPARPLPTRALIGVQLLLLVAAAASVFAVPADLRTGWANWVLGDVGWPLALVAIHRPVRDYLYWSVGVIAILIGGVLVGPGGYLAPVDWTATNLLCALVLQVGTVVAYGMVRHNGVLAEAAMEDAAEIRIARESLDAVSRDRERWHRDLGATLRPLVRGLASGALPPADPEIRGRCAIEASRLRAMLSELAEAGEHSVWRRALVTSLSAAAADRGATMEARIAPDFGAVPEPVRGELVAVVLAVLRMTSPGEVVVTFSGDELDAAATVLLPVRAERPAVREAIRTLLEKVRAVLPGGVTAEVEEPGSSTLWMEVRWIS